MNPQRKAKRRARRTAKTMSQTPTAQPNAAAPFCHAETAIRGRRSCRSVAIGAPRSAGARCMRPRTSPARYSTIDPTTDVVPVTSSVKAIGK